MRLALVALLFAACRGGPTVVIYSGPAVSACPTGRAYPVPPVNAPILAFVPLAEPAPVEAPPPPIEEPVAEPDDKKPPPKKKPPKKKPPPKKKGAP